MKKKLKTLLYCQNDDCGCSIHRKCSESWTEVLCNAGWKWCCEGGYKKPKMLCGYCTKDFEKMLSKQ